MKEPIKRHDQSGRTGQAGKQRLEFVNLYVFNITQENQNE